MPQRRILLLITDLQIGGTPSVVRELAKRLNAPPEVQVEVACLKPSGPVADQLRNVGIGVTSFGVSHPWQIFGASNQLRRLVDEHQIDTVISFLIHANVVAAVASRNLEGVRFFQSIQTVQYWPRWHWTAQRAVHESAEAIIVPSTAVADAAYHRCGIERDRIKVIPNAIDPAEFPAVETFKSHPIRIGFIGRLDRVKFLPELMLAMGRLADFSEFECHIFGIGPEIRTLNLLIQDYHLQGRVLLRGLAATPQEALRQIDILVSPSPYEGFGLVLIEAMACGIPVIAASKGGARDVVRNEFNGLTVGHRNYNREIAAAIVRITDDPALRTKLIENARGTVLKKFTWDVVLPQYRQALGVAPPV